MKIVSCFHAIQVHPDFYVIVRLDERIMQLFSFVNTILKKDRETLKRRLHVVPYHVITLSPSAGLLSWVSLLFREDGKS